MLERSLFASLDEGSSCFFADCGFEGRTIGSKVRKTLFYLTASALLLVIASLRCTSVSHLYLILWLDPALTIGACVVIFVAALEPGKGLQMLCILAVQDMPLLFSERVLVHVALSDTSKYQFRRNDAVAPGSGTVIARLQQVPFPRLSSLQFPEAVFHDLHIWRESRIRVAVSAHLRMESEDRYRMLVRRIHDFFYCLGVNRVTLQPEFEVGLHICSRR